MNPRSMLCAFTALLLLAAPHSVLAQGAKYDDLLERIPTEANLLMFLDIDGLLKSPMAIRDKWEENAKQNRPDPLGVIGVAKLGVVAERLDVASMKEGWRIGMVQASGAIPKLEDLAAREGGYVESIANMPVAFTPRGFSLFRFTDNIVGFVTAIDRQSMVTWVESTLSKPRKFPPSFADEALFKASNGYQVALAVKLDNVVSPKAIEPWLNALPEVKKTFSEPKLIAPRLASVKSAYIAIKVDQSINGVINVEFGQSLEGTGPILRTVVLETMESMGIDLPEIKTWRIALGSKNQSIEMEGRLSVESVRKILSISSPPKMSSPAVKTASVDKPVANSGSMYSGAKSVDPVATSQSYFRAVSGIIASLKSTDRPTYRSQKVWYDRYAKQIEELPILGVDKDLLDWGGLVSRTLREMSSGINYYANNQTYTLASQPNGVYYGYDSYSYNVSSKSYDQAVIKRQSDAMMSVDLDKRWQAIEISVADMRRKMVEKYQVDF